MSWRSCAFRLGGVALTVIAASAPARALSTPPWLTGVNLSGGELNGDKTRLHFDYTYPTPEEIRLFAAKGFRVFRIPVLAARLLGPDPNAVTPDWAIVMTLIGVAERTGVFVLIDMHQYGGMPSGLVGRDAAATSDFAAAWGTIAGRLKDKPNLIFGLMNEPNKQTPAEWRAGAEAGLAAVRKAGARQLVLVPGTAWDGAHSWVASGNAEAFADMRDPAGNMAFEVHQYVDADNSGTHPEAVPGAGAERLQAFTRWARAHHAHGFLGEFGFAGTPEAMREGADLLASMKANRDVWRGWTYWAAGPWWGEYYFSVEPGKDGADKPQMAVLERYK